MKILSIILLVGLWAQISIAAEKSSKGIQPVYTVHVTGDTVWFWGKTFKQPLPFSKFTPNDSSNGLTFEGDFDTLWVSGSLDTTVVLPTTERIRFRFCSARDSVLQTWSCAITKIDSAKVGLLRRYGKFGTTADPTTVSFSYTAPTDSELTTLRTRYNLDSVAGTRDEFSRMTSLLHWLHFRLRHNGNVEYPDTFTPTSIISAADKDGRQFNCGILAQTMNAVFLSMGFVSRSVVCMPGDTADHECHQLTMVWSNVRHKWMLLDPTFDVWFTDTTGTPLSPFEIRTAMAQGDSLRLADCINWNGQPRPKFDQYNYMAKNLFRFKSWADWAEPGSSKKRMVEVWLVPSGYNGSPLGGVPSVPSSGLPAYYTDNADWFFAPPKADSTKDSSQSYRIHTSEDTVWVIGEVRQAAPLRDMHSPDTTKEGGDYDLLVYAGKDTLTIHPTAQPARLWMISDKDSVLEIFIFGPSKVKLLRQYSTFGHTAALGNVQFSYVSPADSNLIKLRQEFHLDSIAGTGDEFSRQRNLLRWVHKRIRHVGDAPNIVPANAVQIISVCDSLKRAVNCYMLATILNDFYLAMGYHTRHLTCSPYDKTDRDSHVITMVWSTQYNKWLYMDPTYDAYWMDTKRVPLSPWQVRTGMVNGDSLILADSVNWNGRPEARQEYYNYMAKNLFRFTCPMEAAFGYESRDSFTRISLEPSAYDPKLLGKAHDIGEKGITYLNTDDPDWFFAPPN